MPRKHYLDLAANPTPSERKAMVREDLVIGAWPADGSGFRGVVVPQQAVDANQQLVGAFVCKHRHDDLTSALTCANELAHALRST
jgi:hypothetical protein